MGVSIYFSVKREQALSSREQQAIDAAIARYSVEDQIDTDCNTGEGLNWSSLFVDDPHDPSEPGIIFEGSARLPDNSGEAGWSGLQHWCRVLSEIRRALPRASWRVHVDDDDILWDEDRMEYDPSR